MEFLFHITGLYPKWYPEAKRYHGPIKGRIAGKDFQKGIGEVIIPFLEEWLDMSLVAKKIRNPIGIPVKWIMKNGSQFDILTYEMNVEQFEGWKGHIAWFDEPPPRDKYIATLRGLVDFRGRNWLTLTPLTQPWIYDDIYTKADGKKTFVVTVDMRDNPHLSEDAIMDFQRNLTEEEKEARLHGRFLHLSGLIYKEFNPNYHICETVPVKNNWTRYFCIDPHPRTPTACLWLAVDPQGQHWVYDELWLDNMNVEQISHAIHAQEGEFQPFVRFIDPAMDKDNELAGGFNTRKEFMKYGIYAQRASTDPLLGQQRIKKALTPQFNKLNSSTEPTLRVSRHCTQTIYEFQHYIWEERKSNAEHFEKKNIPHKRYDHFMDCLRYIYNAGPEYRPPDETEDDEVRYTGEYAKYPEKVNTGSTAYSDLVERKF